MNGYKKLSLEIDRLQKQKEAEERTIWIPKDVKEVIDIKQMMSLRIKEAHDNLSSIADNYKYNLSKIEDDILRKSEKLSEITNTISDTNKIIKAITRFHKEFTDNENKMINELNESNSNVIKLRDRFISKSESPLMKLCFSGKFSPRSYRDNTTEEQFLEFFNHRSYCFTDEE